MTRKSRSRHSRREPSSLLRWEPQGSSPPGPAIRGALTPTPAVPWPTANGKLLRKRRLDSRSNIMLCGNACGVSTQRFVFEHMPFTKHSVQGSPLCSATLSTSLTPTLPLPLNSFPLGVTCSRQGSGQGGLRCCGPRSGSGVQGSRLSYMGAPYRCPAEKQHLPVPVALCPPTASPVPFPAGAAPAREEGSSWASHILQNF